MGNFEIVSMMETLGYTLRRFGNEYHGNCPHCQDPEGDDRFMVFADGNAHCRVCQSWWNADKFRKDFFPDSVLGSPRKNFVPFSSEPKNGVRIISTIGINPLWSCWAEGMVSKASEDLIVGSWGMQELERRGIRPDTSLASNFAAAGVGYITRDLCISGSTLGLTKESIWIPQGILIPTYCSIDGGIRCVKLKVRRQRIDDGLPKYIEISGSSKKCMVLGYHCSKIALVVESELDAILCLQEAEGIVWCVALGGASKPVDEETDSLLKKAPLILWALDQDEAGRKRYFSWRERYSRLRAWPADKVKSPGDMPREKICAWIERGMQKYKEKDWFGQYGSSRML